VAPAGPGEALVGSGLANLRGVVAWERPDLAPLHLDDGYRDRALSAALSGFDVALAYTRSPLVLENLRQLVPRVVARDPLPPPGGPHAALWACAVLDEIEVTRVRAPFENASTEEALAADVVARALPARFLAVHAGSGSLAKNWTSEAFGALTDTLAPDVAWLLVEGPADAGVSEALRAHPHAVHARGLPLRVLGALLARAGLYVGNDSGVTHLAAAWGAPTLALFGPTDPAQWSPIGARVSTLRAPDGRMASLHLADVLAAARAVLTSGADGPPCG
jgi:heptosyltransferase III